MSQWDENVAKDIAKEEEIELTDAHTKVLEYLRNEQSQGNTISIRSIKKSGVVTIQDMYSLFPKAPIKQSTKIAGIPKPASCV